MLNALNPDRMSAEERMAELAGILAAGLMRLRAKQSSGLSAAAENSCVDFTANQSGHAPATQLIARLAALPTMSIAELQRMWRDLNDGEAPRANRKFIESRLAYRIQELAYGGLKPETKARLAALAQAAEGGGNRRASEERKLLVGTRLIREWAGVEHAVTVLADGFEWEGRPYASLSSVARAITGTRWNGWLFFGLKNTKGRN